MSVEIITKEDLQQFKSELLEELLKIIQPDQPQGKQWLKSQDVRKLLNISPGTLQNLRINGTLRFTQIGTIYYYKQEDIYSLLENGSSTQQKNISITGRFMKSL
mgnify:CR=1 FL=1